VITLVVNDFITALEAGLQADGAEKGHHLVILILSPLFEGMVMALRADHAYAKEQLRGLFHRDLGISGDTEEIGRWIFERASSRRQQLAHELVVGFILRDGVANPVAELPHTLVAEVAPADLQQIAPLERPVR